jgi:hypothetical protein
MQSLTLTCTVHQQQDFEAALKASKIKFTKSMAGKINRKPCVTYFFSCKPENTAAKALAGVLEAYELPGMKEDHGKPRTDLLIMDFPRALEAVAVVAGFGTQKYEDHNWLKVENGYKRYLAADLRHKLKHTQGEQVDTDSGLLHLAHAAWNALAVLELELRNGNDK